MASAAPTFNGNGPFRPGNAPDENGVAGFAFRSFDRDFDAWVQNDAHGPSVYVSCPVGVLPYSAENRDARRSALMLLSRVGTIARTRLVLSDFYRISIVARAPLDDPHDSVAILSSAAVAVLGSLPLIEFMGECLNRPPPAKGR